MESSPESIIGAASEPSSLDAESAAIVTRDAAEFIRLIGDLKDKLSELQLRIAPTVESAEAGDIQTSKGVSLLEVKVHSMLSYLTNLAFYLLLKLHGRSVVGHPAIDQLVELRIVMEKIKPLEQKLKYQIDKLVKAAAMNEDQKEATGANGESLATPVGNLDPLNFKPNPSAMFSQGKASTNAQEEDGETEKSGGVYRPPKLAPMPYDEGGRKKTGRLTEQDKQKASRSRLLRDLRSQYDDRPEEENAEGTGYGARDVGASKQDEQWAERERFEEDNFVRLNLTRDDKKLQKNIAQQGARLRFNDEFQALQEDFSDLSRVQRAVADEDEINFGGRSNDMLARKNRRAADIAAGSTTANAGGRKRKFADAADMLSSAAKVSSNTVGKDEFGQQVAKRKKALQKMSKGKGKGKSNKA
ncbi:hypothetical protein HKX48_001531 [Thoreauomyces humboldtii]|nr:hypothetical protein HKX48_001531 [Thoreauomyces humboldtii]